MNNPHAKKARPWDLFNNKIPKVSEQIANDRFSICSSCPHLIQATSQCKKCGCFMKLKTTLPHASCPIGKWDAIEIQQGENK